MKGKRFWLLSFVCVLILSFSCFGLTACKEEAHEHTYGDWTVTKEATCLEAGVETRVCLEDSTHTETRPIPALGHSIVVDEASSTSATCLEAGSKVEKCERCDYTVTTTIPATGHSLSVDESASTLATCTTEGSKVEKCANCSYTVTTPIPATNHSLSVDESASTTATCTTAGVKVEKCSKCSFVATTKEPAKGHDLVVDTENSVAPGCVTYGKKVSKCNNCSYTAEETVNALGHSWDNPVRTCEEGQYCSVCEETTPALGHDYVFSASKSTKLSCETDEVDVYVCNNCDDEFSRVVNYSMGHSVNLWKFDSEEAVEGKTCTYAQTFTGKCSACLENVEKIEETVKHTIKGAITTYATCSAQGEKTFTCSVGGCGYSYTEAYSDDEAHLWDEGTTVSSVTTYTCQHSSEHTHVVVSAKEEVSTDVENDLLKEVGKVELKNATMSFDEKTLNGINGKVSLGANVVNPADIESEVQLPENIDQDAKIFNLTMSENGSQVTNFNGKVTVKVPYELGEGEDPDTIAIYYISEGEVVAIKAKYSNGFAIFETNHFSYYTVTRLSPAERCALYGHSYVETVVEVTCLLDGYTLKICQRCGNSIKTNLIKALGHNIVEEDYLEASCEISGYEKYKCINEGCNYSFTNVTPAYGHYWEETERIDATCNESGSISYECVNEDCDEAYTVAIVQKKHLYVPNVTAPTCIELGYTEYVCSACEHSYVGNYVKANGHDYSKTVIAPTCSEEGYTLYECKNCDSAYTDNKIPASHEWDIEAPTCGKGQTCLKCGVNGLPATGEHSLVGGVCAVCGQGCAHEETTTVIAPTCEEAGYTLTKCNKCGAESKTDYKPATGHTGEFECSVCEEILVEDGFFANILTSSINQNYAILLRGLEFRSPVLNDAIGGVQTYRSELKMEFVELSFYLDEEGNLCGYGYGSVENTNGRFSTKVSMEAIIEGDYLYLKGSEQISDSTRSYGGFYRIPLKEIEGFTGIGQYVKLAIGALKIIKTDVMPFVLNAIENNKDTVDSAMKSAIEALFKASKTSSGYLLEVDFDVFRSFNETLATKSIKEVYEMIAGEGEYEKLADKFFGIFEVKIDDILDFIEENELDLDGIIEKVFEVVEKAGGNFGKVTPEDVKEYIDSNFVRGKTIRDILEKAGALEGFDEAKEEFKDILEEYADSIVYELIIEESYLQLPGLDNRNLTAEDLKDYIDEVIAEIEEGFAFNLYVNADGTLESYEINLNFLGDEDEGGIKLDLEVISNYESKRDYESMLAEAKEVFENIKIEASKFTNVFQGMEVTQNEDGTVTLTVVEDEEVDFDRLYWNENDWNYDENGDLVSITYEARHSKDKIVVTLDLEKDIVSTTVDCGDYIVINLIIPSGYIIEETTEYHYVRYYDSVTEQYSDPVIKNVSVKEYTLSVENISLIYNMVTGQVIVPYDQYGETTAHNFELDLNTSIEAVNCGDRGELHFSCSNCGDSYVQFYYKDHENTEFERTLVDGATSCHDGVIVTEKCLDCNQVVSSYTDYGHIMEDKTILLEHDDCTGLEYYIYLSSCACGYYFNCDVYDYSHMEYYFYDSVNEIEYDKIYYLCDYCDLMLLITSEKLDTANCVKESTINFELVKATVEYSEETHDRYLNVTETILEDKIVQKTTIHENLFTFAELLEGSESCEDGIKIYDKCLDCGYVSTAYEEYYHEYCATKLIDLSEYGDYSGYYIQFGCVCGENNYRDSELIGYSYYNEIYSEQYPQGLQVFMDKDTGTLIAKGMRWGKNEQTCLVTYYEDILFGYNNYEDDYDEKVTVVLSTEYRHDDSLKCELKNNRSESCYDGVNVTATCKVCGDVREYVRYGHVTYNLEEIELHSLGVVCGSPESPPIENAYAYTYTCACGLEKGWRIEIPCDYSVDETIYEHNYYTFLRVYKCAVTDPQCAFKYAVKSYGELIDGDTCSYQRYVDVLFGCDDNGENAKASFLRVPVDKFVYHKSTTQKTVTKDHPCLRFTQKVCVDCGYVLNETSYWDHDYLETKTYVDDKGNTVTESNHCKVCGDCETLIISADESLRTTIHRSFITDIKIPDEYHYSVYSGFKGYRVNTTIEQKAPDGIFDTIFIETRYELIEGSNYVKNVLDNEYHATKIIYQYNEEFADRFYNIVGRDYNADKDGCYSISYEVDKDGKEICITYMGNACVVNSNYWIIDQPATCTQFGDKHLSCIRCGSIRRTAKIYPTFHKFDEYNEETGMFVCTDCGIENLNGANGMISLEECKDVVPDEDVIVVGYYMIETHYGERLDYNEQKRFSEYFALNITLIDKENPENQILVEGVYAQRLDIEGNYVAFNLSDVIEYMTENGYSFDDFDVRLSFVPIGGESYLDYGITFTDLFD